MIRLRDIYLFRICELKNLHKINKYNLVTLQEILFLIACIVMIDIFYLADCLASVRS